MIASSVRPGFVVLKPVSDVQVHLESYNQEDNKEGEQAQRAVQTLTLRSDALAMSADDDKMASPTHDRGQRLGR